ncbi:unnamed protein product [Cyprideis torosa]|uniref:Uncharacterized protein n=1 Tax=Cyprideis torosa TaxID=163714 RepID=A0A7R8WNZ4_9CRUS|nr:unnamed protein product [Cyprideis torosa]CAG0900747.1 unnamed protein product [Cyprideis torosa]
MLAQTVPSGFWRRCSLKVEEANRIPASVPCSDYARTSTGQRNREKLRRMGPVRYAQRSRPTDPISSKLIFFYKLFFVATAALLIVACYGGSFNTSEFELKSIASLSKEQREELEKEAQEFLASLPAAERKKVEDLRKSIAPLSKEQKEELMKFVGFGWLSLLESSSIKLLFVTTAALLVVSCYGGSFSSSEFEEEVQRELKSIASLSKEQRLELEKEAQEFLASLPAAERKRVEDLRKSIAPLSKEQKEELVKLIVAVRANKMGGLVLAKGGLPTLLTVPLQIVGSVLFIILLIPAFPFVYSGVILFLLCLKSEATIC